LLKYLFRTPGKAGDSGEIKVKGSYLIGVLVDQDIQKYSLLIYL